MEYRDVYDEFGKRSGRVVNTETRLANGEYIYHIHIILMTEDGKYILQQRSLTDKYYAGCWDVTGGGVRAGENGVEASGREAREELGINVPLKDIIFIGRLTKKMDANFGMILDIFAAKVNVGSEGIHFSKSEVNDVRLVDTDTFIESVKHDKFDGYVSMLVKADEALRQK